MSKKINVTIWNEYRHEKEYDGVREIYPDGIHVAIRELLSESDDLVIRTATLDEPDCGLPDSVLDSTDVLIWWGHCAHHEVPDELAEKIRMRVYLGMGFIALHSAHMSKPFLSIIGTTGCLRWGRNVTEVVWNIMPQHPIAAGIPDHFTLPAEEIYAEPFQIPAPDELVFLGWFDDGYVFRSGACFNRGAGRIFYFQPGHETYPTYHNPVIGRILRNAVHWAAPGDFGYPVVNDCPMLAAGKITELEKE